MTFARPRPLHAPAPEASPQPGPVDRLGNALVTWLLRLGSAVLFTGSALVRLLHPPFRPSVYLDALAFASVGTLGIIVLTGVFTGAVFALQTSAAFSLFGAKGLVGGSVAVSLLRELAPSLGALIMAGRVGSSITTELGTMRVTEQIDALEAMAVDPVQYLVTPRIVACALALPMLAVAFAAVGLGAAQVVAAMTLGIDRATFLSRIHSWVLPSDVACTVVKATVFGVLIGVIATWKGFHATGGSRGVGLATTSTVVTSSVMVLLADYVLTSLWLRWFPPAPGLI